MYWSILHYLQTVALLNWCIVRLLTAFGPVTLNGMPICHYCLDNYVVTWISHCSEVDGCCHVLEELAALNIVVCDTATGRYRLGKKTCFVYTLHLSHSLLAS